MSPSSYYKTYFIVHTIAHSKMQSCDRNSSMENEWATQPRRWEWKTTLKVSPSYLPFDMKSYTKELCFQVFPNGIESYLKSSLSKNDSVAPDGSVNDEICLKRSPRQSYFTSCNLFSIIFRRIFFHLAVTNAWNTNRELNLGISNILVTLTVSRGCFCTRITTILQWSTYYT